MSRAISGWLRLCAFMAFGMIVLGGYTRVSRSGLSITTWDPIIGALPPMSAAAWNDAFVRYRASPEGTVVNAGMTLDAFQSIYLVEWSHRLLARALALTLGVPLVVLLAWRKLAWRQARPLVIVLAVGAVQGALGWFMVASGLVAAPHVSPFRLAGHLVLGMALFASLVWCAQERGRARVSRVVITSLAAAAVTVALGGLVAGFHAGLVCSTFPTMNGDWLPRNLEWSRPNAWTLHFLHRVAALATVLIAAAAAIARFRDAPVVSLSAFACAALQIVLGALLVTRHVPPALAVIHQGNAALLVALLVVLLHEVKRRRAARCDCDDVAIVHEGVDRRGADAA